MSRDRDNGVYKEISKNILDTAKRVYMLLNKIYKYAVTLEYVPRFQQ